MGWFESQIQERRDADQQLLEDSFAKIAGVVTDGRGAQKLFDARIKAKNAIDEILKFYHLRPVELPERDLGLEQQLDECLRPYGLMRRVAELGNGWYKDAFGPMLLFLKESRIPVAALPGSFRGYFFKDPETGQQLRVNSKTASRFEAEAICFYQPLPQKKLEISDLMQYIRHCLSVGDVAALVLSTLALTLAGLLLPKITRLLTGPVLQSGQSTVLLGAAVMLLCVTSSSQLLTGIKGLTLARLNAKASLSVQAAVMARLLSLPASFFRKYSPGALKSRVIAVAQLSPLLLSTLLSAALGAVASLLYLPQMYRYAPKLLLPSICVMLLTLILSTGLTLLQVRISRQRMKQEARESGMSYSIISGVQKLKLAGAEKRAFAKWLDIYADGAALLYNPPTILKLGSVITTAVSLLSNLLLYALAVRSALQPADWFAFTAAYGAAMGAFGVLSSAIGESAQIRPTLELAEPILQAEPETAELRQNVTRIRGGVELDHVSFRYEEDSPYVLRDLSLKIHPGEYVAIVGKTGCGKSTLLRLLLGFEKPEKGAVFYDGKNLDSLDLSSLRKKIGVVMQDAGLFQGDIYSNIVISAPELSVEAAWEAAEAAGIADDIRAMPMGMHTVISEGQGGISGGQRQRLLIARAIAPKPKLLIFDEATSALDNKTQKQVVEALHDMGCTRIVIAHRLSTVMHCDRILVLDQGRIAEAGSYAELIEKGGLFADLVERQQI